MKIFQGLKMLSQIKNHLPTAERRRKVTQILRVFFIQNWKIFSARRQAGNANVRGAKVYNTIFS